VADALFYLGLLLPHFIKKGPGCFSHGSMSQVLLESLEYLLTTVKSQASTTLRSGGDLGCSPYFAHGQGTEHFATSNAAPSCPTTCGNSAFQKALHADTFKLGLDQFIEVGFFFPMVF
jgi:hypothetical protein